MVVGLDVGTLVSGALVGALVSPDVCVLVFGAVRPVVGPLVGERVVVVLGGQLVGSDVGVSGFVRSEHRLGH
jgi:hypothetical protein